ncbi:hypothetical protein AB0F18_19345 [Streptomyces sp. NPDC029216]|uniref:hypothetical protein n=1 Tax=Streptomyces sp. NPDC029216 TaxID=3154701 RepID=UPI0034047AF0
MRLVRRPGAQRPERGQGRSPWELGVPPSGSWGRKGGCSAARGHPAAAPDLFVPRASVGRIGEEATLRLSDRDLVRRAVGELHRAPHGGPRGAGGA